MSWNYRVVHRVEDGEDVYAIHEAYYDGDKPTSITENPVRPQGATISELQQDFEAYQKALTQPVLEYDSFDSKSGERGAVLLVLLIPTLLTMLGVFALFAGVRGMQAQVFGHTGIGALSGAKNNRQEPAPRVQPTAPPELRGPIDLGTASLVCVKLPGVSYPKTPALDRRVAPRLYVALQELERQNAPPLSFNYGFRSTCEQERIRPVGTAQKATPGTSAHERGAAVDVAQLRARSDHRRVIGVFREQGWTWGSADWPHFEIRPHVIGEPDKYEWVRRQQRDFNAGRVEGGCKGGPCGGL